MTPYTIKSDPPPTTRRGKRSYWPEVLAEVRAAKGGWRMVAKPMTRSTAMQVASDLRNAHRRDPKKLRLRGGLPTDRWETQWASGGNGSPEYFVWVRDASSGVAER
jgi:hypothetical protein